MPFGLESFGKRKSAPPAEAHEDTRLEEFEDPKTKVRVRFIQLGGQLEVTLSGRIEPTENGNQMSAVNCIFEPNEKAQAEKLYAEVKAAISEKSHTTDDAEAVFEAGEALFPRNDYDAI